MKATSQPDSTATTLDTTSRGARRTRGRIIALVLGDALAFLLFAGLGRETHHEASGLAALAQVALTATPFALGWFLVSPWLGAFRRARTATPSAMLRSTLIAWVVSWPVTLLLRWGFTAAVPPVSFALVILVANTVFLSIWRGGFALVARWLGARSAASR